VLRIWSAMSRTPPSAACMVSMRDATTSAVLEFLDIVEGVAQVDILGRAVAERRHQVGLAAGGQLLLGIHHLVCNDGCC
jgi:hypothetical protein